ncbi:hypothetical protein [Rhodococcus maanshanensis]|uniref:hypothetical protein n=1 Tax=Rhodococcus maanshanensis TaxID=183556 RepID=UPI001160D582|nr:hypothetical protein [Rhodococcus maanshanensis]
MRKLWLRLIIGASAGAAVGVTVVLARRRGITTKAIHATEGPIKEHTPHIHPAEITANVRENLPQQVKRTASRLAASPAGEATRHAGQVVAETARHVEERAEKFAKDHAHRDGHHTD